MTKKQLFTLLALSTMVLTQTGSILADDVTPPVDSTTQVWLHLNQALQLNPSQPTPVKRAHETKVTQTPGQGHGMTVH